MKNVLHDEFGRRWGRQLKERGCDLDHFRGDVRGDHAITCRRKLPTVLACSTRHVQQPASGGRMAHQRASQRVAHRPPVQLARPITVPPSMIAVRYDGIVVIGTANAAAIESEISDGSWFASFSLCSEVLLHACRVQARAWPVFAQIEAGL